MFSRVAAKKLRVARSTLSRSSTVELVYSSDGSQAIRCLRTEPGMWLDLQQQFDLWHAAQRKRPKVEKFFKAA